MVDLLLLDFRAAVTELWCQLIADDLVWPTDHVTYASPTIGR